MRVFGRTLCFGFRIALRPVPLLRDSRHKPLPFRSTLRPDETAFHWIWKDRREVWLLVYCSCQNTGTCLACFGLDLERRQRLRLDWVRLLWWKLWDPLGGFGAVVGLVRVHCCRFVGLVGGHKSAADSKIRDLAWLKVSWWVAVCDLIGLEWHEPGVLDRCQYAGRRCSPVCLLEILLQMWLDHFNITSK